MDYKKLKQGLRALRSSIEDFLDELDMDEAPKAEGKKFSTAVEEDKDGKKLSH